MTADPVTIPVEAKLSEALRRMDEHRVRHLPVVRDGQLVGILSDRDLFEVTGGLAAAEADELAATTVEDIMHEPVTAHPDDSVVAISVEVVLRGIGCLPVVQDRRLVGIVSECDLLRLFYRVSQVGELAGDVDPPIREHMTQRVVTLRASDTLADALEVRRSVDIRHLPVVEEGHLVGLVSDRDLRRALGKRLDERETSIEELMVRDVRTLGPSDPLSAAASIMVERKISALPIVAVKTGELVGILSSTDLLDHCMNTLRFAE